MVFHVKITHTHSHSLFKSRNGGLFISHRDQIRTSSKFAETRNRLFIILLQLIIGPLLLTEHHIFCPERKVKKKLQGILPRFLIIHPSACATQSTLHRKLFQQLRLHASRRIKLYLGYLFGCSLLCRNLCTICMYFRQNMYHHQQTCCLFLCI